MRTLEFKEVEMAHKIAPNIVPNIAPNIALRMTPGDMVW